MCVAHGLHSGRLKQMTRMTACKRTFLKKKEEKFHTPKIGNINGFLKLQINRNLDKLVTFVSLDALVRTYN